jgi:hypothetical protein
MTATGQRIDEIRRFRLMLLLAVAATEESR